MADKNRSRAESASEQDLRDDEGTDQPPIEGEPTQQPPQQQPPTEQQSDHDKNMSDVEQTAGGRSIN